MTATRNEKGHTPTKSAAPTTRARDTTLVYIRGGDLVTGSLTIAREFGRRHDHVLRTLDSLIADSTVGRPNFEETSYTDESNRQQRIIELDERGALISMPFIGGRNSRKGQVRLVDAFLALRPELAARTAPDCLSARCDAATNFTLLSEMLTLSRDAEGKTTQAYHYANEVRLVNRAFCGVFGPLDRDALTASDLRVLAKLQVRDAALIGSGKTYAERKAMLADYAATLHP
jgi:Rha family phage regulatory protein